MQSNYFCCILHQVLATEKFTYQETAHYELIAIASPAKDYKASFFVNQALHIQLEKDADIEIDVKAKQIKKVFGKYTYADELTGMEYILICNKASTGAFFTTLKNFDYILVLKTYELEEDMDVYSLAEKLRNVSEFQAALHAAKLTKKEEKLLQEFF